MTTFNFKECAKYYADNIYDEDLFAVDDTVHCWIFDRNNNWQKYNKKNAKDKFLLTKINHIRKFSYMSDEYAMLYQKGLYVILDYKPNWLMFVFPTEKFNNIFADHYSIPYNPVAKKQVQFHITKYVPDLNESVNPNGLFGGSMHKEYHFKDDCSYNNINFNDITKIEREALMDLLQYHHRSDGGGKRKASLNTGPKQKKVKATVKADLGTIWDVHKIEHVFVFAVKHNGKYSVTCSVYDKVRRRKDVAHKSFGFIIDILDSNMVRDGIVRGLMEKM